MSENDNLWIEVDLGAIRHNYREIKNKLAVSARGVIAVVKASAYGHGLAAVARVLEEEGASYLAVGHLGEGIALREAGIACPILVMTPQLPRDLPAFPKYRLVPTVDGLAALKELEKVASGVEIPFHLKLNLGMNRFGLNPADIEEFAAALRQCPDLRMEAVFSHLATALVKDHPATRRQIEAFRVAKRQVEAAVGRPVLAHLANSAAALAYPQSHWDYLRVGTLLYGQVPAAHFTSGLDLRNTWTAKARLIAIREAKAGDTVGYGGDFKVRRGMKLGVLPVGYRDGFGVQPPLNNVRWRTFMRQALRLLRAAFRRKGANYVLHEGCRLPVVGRIAMQTAMVDIGVAPLQAGDTVEVPMRRTASSPILQTIYKDDETSIE